MRFRRLAKLPMLAVRQLRWMTGSWSKSRDREYHDVLYHAQDHDPFHPDYPGYVTIRRFADHVEPLLPAAGTVLDVGCGPGEITCELARRHRHLTFIGIDHSSQAIERANRNVERLGLPNATFQTGDAEALPAAQRYALVTMFDAFHHIERPRHFLAWLRARTTRCLLIEPAGTVTGRWARDLDVDWLLLDLANIRDRLEAICGARPANDPSAAKAGPPTYLARGEGAVERRYALDDFERFFDGWHLSVHGTVAGFDTYPTQPHARGPLRAGMGDAAYALVKVTEELLRTTGRDLAAKHWVIAASTEADLLATPALRRDLTAAMAELPERTVASAFDAEYSGYDGPSTTAAGAEFRAIFELRNRGWDTWSSDGDQPVHASYHWLEAGTGVVAELDGRRSRLPRPVGPNEICKVFLVVVAPPTPGSYVLAIDLVKEGVAWFNEAGMAWHTVPVRVVAG